MINITMIKAKKQAVKEKHERVDFLGILGLLTEQEILLKTLEEIEIKINDNLNDFTTVNPLCRSVKEKDFEPVILNEE